MNREQASLGTIIVTPGAKITMDEQGVQTAALLQQYLDDAWQNEFTPAAMDGFTILRKVSAQKMPIGELWVTTEFDRQVTTISLPGEP